VATVPGSPFSVPVFPFLLALGSRGRPRVRATISLTTGRRGRYDRRGCRVASAGGDEHFETVGITIARTRARTHARTHARIDPLGAALAWRVYFTTARHKSPPHKEGGHERGSVGTSSDGWVTCRYDD